MCTHAGVVGEPAKDPTTSQEPSSARPNSGCIRGSPPDLAPSVCSRTRFFPNPPAVSTCPLLVRNSLMMVVLKSLTTSLIRLRRSDRQVCQSETAAGAAKNTLNA